MIGRKTDGKYAHTREFIKRQLYIVVSLYIFIAVCLLGLSRIQSQILDSVRAYVAGEGFWSKAQKDAIFHLIRYASSRDEKSLNYFHTGISVALGDRQARLALQSKPPDLVNARAGFLRARIHPDDIDNMIWLYVHFSEYSQLKQAIELWTDGDKVIDELFDIEKELKTLFKSREVSHDKLIKLIARIDSLNERVSEIQNRFSSTLGEAARKIKRISSRSVIFAAIIMLLIGLFLSRKILHSIQETQTALVKSEARFRHVVESNIIGIMFWDIDGSINEANEKFLNIIGYTREDLNSGRINWRAITPEEYRAADAFALEEIARNGYCTPFEKEYMHKHGYRISVYSGAASFDTNAKTGVCFIIDITENKMADQAQKLATTVFLSSKEAIMVTDKSAAIKAVNPAFTKITGYTADEVIDQNPKILGSGEHDDRFFADMWKSLALTGSWKGELWNRRKNGELFKELLSISAILDTNDQVSQYVGIFADITEQHRLEEQLRQSQKMEAIGTLVGGIAHDFNNTLAAIQGNLYLAKMNIADNPAVEEKLEVIEKLGVHSAEIIQQLLTFARKGHVKMVPISLNSMFAGMLRITKSYIPENIHLKFSICEQPLFVKGDVSQLQQVVLNLITNSRDALVNISDPQIECHLTTFIADKLFLNAHPNFQTNQLACIMVKDNGVGISSEHLKQVFDPFFTTKDIGKGTGLGMSMVYGAIQTHGGFINLQSKPNKGTTVYIYLPQISAEQNNLPASNTLPDFSENQFTLLLVDDNQNVRDVYAEAIESLGYRVVTASTGREAVQVFDSQSDFIHLVISDIVMPDMDGFQALEIMRVLQPNLPVIFITGYDPETSIPKALRDNSYLLSKPFDMSDLMFVIQHMLTQAKSY